MVVLAQLNILPALMLLATNVYPASASVFNMLKVEGDIQESGRRERYRCNKLFAPTGVAIYKQNSATWKKTFPVLL